MNHPRFETLPAGCIYNGAMQTRDNSTLCLYTDLVYGGTFSLPLDADYHDLNMQLKRHRESFEPPLPPCPVLGIVLIGFSIVAAIGAFWWIARNFHP